MTWQHSIDHIASTQLQHPRRRPTPTVQFLDQRCAVAWQSSASWGPCGTCCVTRIRPVSPPNTPGCTARSLFTAPPSFALDSYFAALDRRRHVASQPALFPPTPATRFSPTRTLPPRLIANPRTSQSAFNAPHPARLETSSRRSLELSAYSNHVFPKGLQTLSFRFRFERQM
jgi:hypothetical protein